MRNLLALAIVAILLSCPYPEALGDEGSTVGTGTFRIGVNTGFSYNLLSVSALDIHTINFGADVDYFINDFLTVGPAFELTYANVENSSEDEYTFLIGGAFGVATLASDKLVPYFKVIPGVGIFDLGLGNALKKFSIGVQAGLDFLIVDHIAVGISFRYDRIFTDPDISIFSIPLRFALYFY